MYKYLFRADIKTGRLVSIFPTGWNMGNIANGQSYSTESRKNVLGMLKTCTLKFSFILY